MTGNGHDRKQLLPWDDNYEEPKPLLQVSYVHTDDIDGSGHATLPQLPKQFDPTKLRSHLESLAFNLLTTPGLITRELTDEDKTILTAAEVLLYEEIKASLDPDCQWSRRQYWLERLLPPIPKRIESLSVRAKWESFAEGLPPAPDYDTVYGITEITEARTVSEDPSEDQSRNQNQNDEPDAA